MKFNLPFIFIQVLCGFATISTTGPRKEKTKGEDENRCSDDDDESSNQTLRTSVAHYEDFINKI